MEDAALFQKMTEIDQFALDKEWTRQPENMFLVMEGLARARHAYDEAKDQLAYNMALLDASIRDDASANGFKLTEKAIENRINLNEDIKKLSAKVAELKYNINILEAARAGLENKREALTNLVKLHGMAYFAEPEADIETRGKLDDIRQEEAKKKVKISNPKRADKTKE